MATLRVDIAHLITTGAINKVVNIALQVFVGQGTKFNLLSHVSLNSNTGFPS